MLSVKTDYDFDQQPKYGSEHRAEHNTYDKTGGIYCDC
jgi:hypothetical protein